MVSSRAGRTAIILRFGSKLESFYQKDLRVKLARRSLWYRCVRCVCVVYVVFIIKRSCHWCSARVGGVILQTGLDVILPRSCLYRCLIEAGRGDACLLLSQTPFWGKTGHFYSMVLTRIWDLLSIKLSIKLTIENLTSQDSGQFWLARLVWLTPTCPNSKHAT